MNKRTMLLVSSTMLLSSAFMSSAVSAVTYQTGVGVSFTFNPKLTLTLSSSNLVISNLAPGTSDNSNEIAITVSTNAAYGYNLSATVGNSTTYNNRDLTHTSGSSAGKFSSIAFQSNPSNYTSSFTTDNTWGYSIDSGTKYNGLPLYSDTTNIATLKSTDTTPATGTDTVNFLIGARASTTQPTGDYKNVINFIAVTNPVPLTLEASYEAAGKTKYNGYYKLQDMSTAICDNAEVLDEGSQMQAIDTRDNKIYWITKLQDGHCWMTQNLDLDLGVATLTHNSTTLYHDDTDLGWGSDTATTSWTPANNTQTVTYDSNMKGTFSSLGISSTEDNVPKSLDVGDWYYAGYDGTTLLTSTTVNYLTSDNRVKNGDIVTVNNGNGVDYFSTAPFATNGAHGHVGNYYNWSAAVASNDTSSYSSSTYEDPDNNPQNSICPAGWRLPIITSYSFNILGDNEFVNLNYYYNNKASNTSVGLEASPLFFARGGYVGGAYLYVSGNLAYYWSSSVDGKTTAYNLYMSDTYIHPPYAGYRYYGSSVRCLAR